MTTSKDNFVQFGKAAGFGLAIFVALISYAGILNGVVAHGLEPFYAVVGFLNLGLEAFGIVKLYKYLFPKEDKKSEK